MEKDKDTEELSLQAIDEDYGRSSFAARDIYTGPERRKVHRRQTADRRTHLRFEAGKLTDRRQTPERRENGSWKGGSSI